MQPLQVGTQAPDFSLPDQDGQQVSLSSLRGKKVLIYFYPKAMTPGCTTQACGVQEALPQLGRLGLEVIGVSPDAIPPIEKFAAKYGHAFPLASDADHKVAEAYGVWVEKSMYGRKYMGIERATFLIDGKGVVRKVWRKVKVPGHVEEVLAAAKAL